MHINNFKLTYVYEITKIFCTVLRFRDEKKKIESRFSRVTSRETFGKASVLIERRKGAARRNAQKYIRRLALRARKVKSLIRPSVPQARKPFLVYSFWWDLEGVTRRSEARPGRGGDQKRKTDCRYPRATLNSDNGMTWSYHYLHLRARISSTTRQGRLPWRNKLACRVRHLRPSDFNNKAAGTSGSRESLLPLSLFSSFVSSAST